MKHYSAPAMDDFTLRYASELDRHDPLGSYRDQFVIADPTLIYLDGNSLGRLPYRTVDYMERTIR